MIIKLIFALFLISTAASVDEECLQWMLDGGVLPGSKDCELSCAVMSVDCDQESSLSIVDTVVTEQPENCFFQLDLNDTKNIELMQCFEAYLLKLEQLRRDNAKSLQDRVDSKIVEAMKSVFTNL